jgi:large subunit ribosomal protein L25
MKHLPLQAWSREAAGTGIAHRLRREGYVPSVLIGHHEKAVCLKVRHPDILRVLQAGGQNALVDLDVDGQSHLAMVREYTRNPLSRHITHVDFQRVSADEKVETNVPLVFTGRSVAQDEGGIVQHELEHLHVRAKADDVPQHIEVDISALRPGHPMHVSEIALPPGVECLTLADHVLAIVTMRRGHGMEEDDALAAAELAAEGEAASSTT